MQTPDAEIAAARAEHAPQDAATTRLIALMDKLPRSTPIEAPVDEQARLDELEASAKKTLAAKSKMHALAYMLVLVCVFAPLPPC